MVFRRKISKKNEPRRKISKKSPKIGEPDSEMSSNLTNEYKVKKQTPSRAHERKPKGLAGRLSVYTQRRNEARRRAEGALEVRNLILNNVN